MGCQLHHETFTERLDRNWTELLQELRAVQTGVQFLTGFLLTLPFQQRFTTPSPAQRVVYLVAVDLAVGSTAMVIAPVAVHRMLFRQYARPELVSLAHRLALISYWLLAAAVTAVVLLILYASRDAVPVSPRPPSPQWRSPDCRVHFHPGLVAPSNISRPSLTTSRQTQRHPLRCAGVEVIEETTRRRPSRRSAVCPGD